MPINKFVVLSTICSFGIRATVIKDSVALFVVVKITVLRLLPLDKLH
jgi:hypothetical protein